MRTPFMGMSRGRCSDLCFGRSINCDSRDGCIYNSSKKYITTKNYRRRLRDFMPLSLELKAVYIDGSAKAGVAQLVEQRFRKPQVARSIRVAGSIILQQLVRVGLPVR